MTTERTTDADTILAELVDNLLSYHNGDTHCWYCSRPAGEHRADCVWGRAIAWLRGGETS